MKRIVEKKSQSGKSLAVIEVTSCPETWAELVKLSEKCDNETQEYLLACLYHGWQVRLQSAINPTRKNKKTGETVLVTPTINTKETSTMNFADVTTTLAAKQRKPGKAQIKADLLAELETVSVDEKLSSDEKLEKIMTIQKQLLALV